MATTDHRSSVKYFYIFRETLNKLSILVEVLLKNCAGCKSLALFYFDRLQLYQMVIKKHNLSRML